MSPKFLERQSTRREMLRNSAAFAGSGLLAQLFPASLLSAGVPDLRQQAATASTDPLAAMRAQMGGAPIQSQPLADQLTLLSGPGGNVVVLNGPDGKIVVDTFLMPAWPKLKKTLDGLGNAPLQTVIDTHWHFDHTDNNANLHAAGATVLAHEKHQDAHGRATRQCAFGFARSGVAPGCFAAADIQQQPKTAGQR
jgi:hypothetical protein